MSINPPRARRHDRVIEQHGEARIDPYAWLKAPNWREAMRDPAALDPDIRAYLEEENAYTRTVLEEPTRGLQEALFAEMRARLAPEDSSPPAIDGPFAYFRRFRADGEHPLFLRRAREDAFSEDNCPETLLLDGDAIAAGQDYCDIRKVAHSPDHRWIAYAVDYAGSEFYTIRLRSLTEGSDAEEVISDTYGDFVWSSDSASIYWVARDENARPAAVFRRRIGAGEDTLIYREPDPGFFIGLGKSQSGEFIYISANNHTTSEWRVLPAAGEPAEPFLIAAREPGVEYSVHHFDDRFYFLTNAGGAIDFAIMSSEIAHPGRDGWRTEVPFRPGVLILAIETFRDYLVRLERENGLPRIVVRSRVSGDEHVISFPDPAYAISITNGYHWSEPLLRFDYSSPSRPSEIYDYDMRSRDRVLRKRQPIPSGHDPLDYVVERLDAPAHDAETIPVWTLRRRDTPLDGTAPLLLYGYGAYGLTIPADFRTARLSLVDRGVIYAVAEVRGSMAKGYDWYLKGKLEHKENSFLDFLSAAACLADGHRTRPGQIVAMGGSAGGLLMGACANMNPTLFAGMIAAVPFVDVLNTMSDESLPLTPPEWPEWGDPITDIGAFARIRSYAPYEQVADRPYPPLLITGGLTDPRVTYWEPAKWIAKLRHEAPAAGPYFLRMNMDAGHAGSSGRYASLRETALEYAFALSCVGLGITLVQPPAVAQGQQ